MMQDDAITLKKLTIGQMKFVESLLAGTSIKASAKVAGVTERTAHNWLLLDQVKQAIAQGKEALFTSALSRIELLSLAAVDRLQELMTDPEAPHSVQASCARALAAKRLEVASISAPVSEKIDWSVFTQAQLDVIQPIFEAAEKAGQEKQA